MTSAKLILSLVFGFSFWAHAETSLFNDLAKTPDKYIADFILKASATLKKQAKNSIIDYSENTARFKSKANLTTTTVVREVSRPDNNSIVEHFVILHNSIYYGTVDFKRSCSEITETPMTDFVYGRWPDFHGCQKWSIQSSLLNFSISFIGDEAQAELKLSFTSGKSLGYISSTSSSVSGNRQLSTTAIYKSPSYSFKDVFLISQDFSPNTQIRFYAGQSELSPADYSTQFNNAVQNFGDSIVNSFLTSVRF